MKKKMSFPSIQEGRTKGGRGGKLSVTMALVNYEVRGGAGMPKMRTFEGKVA